MESYRTFPNEIVLSLQIKYKNIQHIYTYACNFAYLGYSQGG